MSERHPGLGSAGVMDASRDGASCPFCKKPSPRWIQRKALDLSTPVETALEARRPGWQADDGVCLSCVQETLDALLSGPGRVGFYGDSLGYEFGRLQALPLHSRLGADPQLTGRGVGVAFLDSGFYPHRGLVEPLNRIVVHVDVGGSRPIEHRLGARATWPTPLTPPSTSWHGSMTSTFALGNGLESEGLYRGLASSARAILVKLTGPKGKIGDRQIAAGLRWVLAHHERYAISVVNISCGGDHVVGKLRSPVNRLVRRLFRAGVCVVAAAGNRPVRGLVPPASAPEAICVGGLDDRNSRDPQTWRAWHSTFGPTEDGIAKPDLLAPSLWLAAPILPATKEQMEARCLEAVGDHPAASALGRVGLSQPIVQRLGRVRSAALPRFASRRRRALRLVDGLHQHVEGTSFSAPIVAATVAQLLEADPLLKPRGIREVLTATALPLPGVELARQGGGAIRPGAAAAYALRLRRWFSRAPSPAIKGRELVFHLLLPEAESVEILESWNSWRVGHPMHEVVKGVWRAFLPLPPPGRHGYLFSIDGCRLSKDPENPREEPDGYGGSRSIIEV